MDQPQPKLTDAQLMKINNLNRDLAVKIRSYSSHKVLCEEIPEDFKVWLVTVYEVIEPDSIELPEMDIIATIKDGAFDIEFVPHNLAAEVIMELLQSGKANKNSVGDLFTGLVGQGFRDPKYTSSPPK